MLIERRSFLTGLASIVAAPAIVRASSLMPVKALIPFEFETEHKFILHTSLPEARWRMFNMGMPYAKAQNLTSIMFEATDREFPTLDDWVKINAALRNHPRKAVALRHHRPQGPRRASRGGDGAGD